MNDANRLRTMRLVLAAIKSELNDRGGTDDITVPLDAAAFARAVRKLGDNTELGASFPVLTVVTGLHCPEFRHGMGVAQSAGIISRLNPSFQRFTVNLSARQIATIAMDEKFSEAQGLAKEYLALTIGVRTGSDRGADSRVA